jgi:hypothetical protein
VVCNEFGCNELLSLECNELGSNELLLGYFTVPCTLPYLLTCTNLTILLACDQIHEFKIRIVKALDFHPINNIHSPTHLQVICEA